MAKAVISVDRPNLKRDYLRYTEGIFL